MVTWYRHKINPVHVNVLTLDIKNLYAKWFMLWMGLYWPEEALLEHRETTSFPDQHIRDLTDLYTDEKYSVARILLVQPLTESL